MGMKRKPLCTLLTGVACLTLSASTASAVLITTATIATGLNRPVYATAAPGLPNHLFVVEKRGVIKVIDLTTNTVLATPFLDINAVVVNPTSGNDERGLLGLAFHPDYATNRLFYVDYVNNSSNTVIALYKADAGGITANPATATIMKTIIQPQTNHNGGCLQFGPDGMLYIGMGDGGGGGDQHGTIGNGQNLGTLLGKILRLDVNIASPFVPADNPFVGPGDPLDEIWAFGVRNPWRFSFDRATGDLYIADVGQGSWEEVDFAPSTSTGGENYGWRCMEGNACFTSPSGPNCTCNGPNLTDPVFVYSHGGAPFRCSIDGGYVYRGLNIPGENGNYFYGDFCSGQIWSFKIVGGAATGNTQRFGFGSAFDLTSFGEDTQGELYLVSGIGTTNGTIRKIVPTNDAPADINADGSIDLIDADILVDVLLDVDVGDPALVHRADVSGDGAVNGLDIQAWIDQI